MPNFSKPMPDDKMKMLSAALKKRKAEKMGTKMMEQKPYGS